jgi:hypothetical protein
MTAVLRSEVLGAASELSKGQAQNLLEDRLRPVNEGRTPPRSMITFRRFVKQTQPNPRPAQQSGDYIMTSADAICGC